MTEKNIGPLDRRQVMNQLVTRADDFSIVRYDRLREQTPRLPELEEQGAAMPGSEAILADLYYSLWTPDPEVKSESETPPARQYWRRMLDEALRTTSFQQLHADTELSELKSVLGTVQMGETILAAVPKKDREQLKELQSAQEQADNAAAEARSAQAQADRLGALAEQMMANAQGSGNGQQGQAGGQSSPGGSGSSQSQNGSPSSPGGKSGQTSGGGASQLTAEQARALADRLQEEWVAAQELADVAKQVAGEAQAAAQAKADALLGQPGSAEAEAKLRRLAQIGLAAVKAATARVEEVSETIQSWGLDETELSRIEMPEALGLLQKMGRNAAFKKFAALLGRLRAMAAKKARSKTEGEGRRVTRTETGRDIARATTSERVSLAHPTTRFQAYLRWAQGALQLRGQETKKPLGHGPVIVCEDGSGSMEGAKQQWAKGVTLALAHFAKLRKRNFGWLLFDYGVRTSRVYPKGALSAKQMLELAESFAGGGTNFEAPLKRAVEMIMKEGLKKADIVFVTDGECAVSEKFLREFRAAKVAFEFNVVTVLCDVGQSVDATVREFSDRIEHVSSFSAEEAETKVFSHL